jgi:hypothetical protein
VGSGWTNIKFTTLEALSLYEDLNLNSEACDVNSSFYYGRGSEKTHRSPVKNIVQREENNWLLKTWKDCNYPEAHQSFYKIIASRDHYRSSSGTSLATRN